MIITLDLKPDVEARLRATAERRGQSLEEYVQDIIERDAFRDLLFPMKRKKQRANDMRGSRVDAPGSGEDDAREKPEE